MLTKRSRVGSGRIKFTAPTEEPIVKPTVTGVPDLQMAGPAPLVPFPDTAMTATLLTVLNPSNYHSPIYCARHSFREKPPRLIQVPRHQRRSFNPENRSGTGRAGSR